MYSENYTSSFDRKAETSFVLHSPKRGDLGFENTDWRHSIDGTPSQVFDGIPIPTERRHEPLLIIEGGGEVKVGRQNRLRSQRTNLWFRNGWPLSGAKFLLNWGQFSARLSQESCLNLEIVVAPNTFFFILWRRFESVLKKKFSRAFSWHSPNSLF